MDSLPEILQWLVATPWWVSTLMLLATIAASLWLSWPDMSAAKSLEQSLIDLKAANKRAWEFSATHHTVINKLRNIEHSIKENAQRTDAIYEYLEVTYSKKLEVEGTQGHLNRNIEGLHMELRMALDMASHSKEAIKKLEARIVYLERQSPEEPEKETQPKISPD